MSDIAIWNGGLMVGISDTMGKYVCIGMLFRSNNQKINSPLLPQLKNPRSWSGSQVRSLHFWRVCSFVCFGFNLRLAFSVSAVITLPWSQHAFFFLVRGVKLCIDWINAEFTFCRKPCADWRRPWLVNPSLSKSAGSV